MRVKRIIICILIIIFGSTLFVQSASAAGAFKVRYHVNPLYLTSEGGYVTLTVTITNTSDLVLSGKDVSINTDKRMEAHWKTSQAPGTTATDTFKIYFNENDLDVKKTILVETEHMKEIPIPKEEDEEPEFEYIPHHSSQTLSVIVRNLDKANIWKLIHHYGTHWYYNLIDSLKSTK